MSRTRAAVAALTIVLTSFLSSGCLATALLPEEEPPQPKVPAMPDAATARTDAGADAFVRHYLAVEDYALQTADVGELQVLIAPACGGCADIVFAARAAERVGRLEGGARSIEALRAMPVADGAD